MDDVKLTVASNPTNKHIKGKEYSKVGVTTTLVFAAFVGATALKMPSHETNFLKRDFANPSYIQYINLDSEMSCEELFVNVDLLKCKNLEKIKKMELFQDNWNGTGGCAFSAKALERFVEVIEVLNKQPKIAPTGRNSLLMQYEKDDKSLLAFEVGEEKVEKVFIPRGDYALAEMEVYTEDFGQKIVETVRKFYGFA